MDKNRQLKEAIAGIGALAEMSLVFFRGAVGAGASLEEATRMTQAYIAAAVWGRPKDEGPDK